MMLIRERKYIIGCIFILLIAFIVSFFLHSKCSVPDCMKRGNGDYCKEHTCQVDGCLDKRITLYYCAGHSCQVSNCTKQRGKHAEHNIEKCQYVGCQKEFAGYGTYCGKCHVADCDNTVEDNYNNIFCKKHTCTKEHCNHITEGGSLCLYHMYF